MQAVFTSSKTPSWEVMLKEALDKAGKPLGLVALTRYIENHHPSAGSKTAVRPQVDKHVAAMCNRGELVKRVGRRFDLPDRPFVSPSKSAGSSSTGKGKSKKKGGAPKARGGVAKSRKGKGKRGKGMAAAKEPEVRQLNYAADAPAAAGSSGGWCAVM